MPGVHVYYTCVYILRLFPFPLEVKKAGQKPEKCHSQFLFLLFFTLCSGSSSELYIMYCIVYNVCIIHVHIDHYMCISIY